MQALNQGQKIKLPEWQGHWFIKDGKILVETRTGDILDTPYLDDYKNRTDWQITDGCRDFGGALTCLKAGRRIARKGWNGKGLFVFMQIPAEIDEEIVPKMQSLPQSVKDEFARRGGSIRYSNQMALVSPNNSINGWAPSVSDALAEDWIILD